MNNIKLNSNNKKLNKIDIDNFINAKIFMKPKNEENVIYVNLSLSNFVLKHSDFKSFVDKLNFCEDFIKLINSDEFDDLMLDYIKKSDDK